MPAKKISFTIIPKLAVTWPRLQRMTKLRLLILVSGFLLPGFPLLAQQQYPLYLRGVDRDSVFLAGLGIPGGFTSRNECVQFINELPVTLRSRGYITTSLDSVIYDSSYARLVVFLGAKYEWETLDVSGVDPLVLDALGWRKSGFSGSIYDQQQINDWQDKILSHMENNGYPFAKVWVDSLSITDDRVHAKLHLDKGPAYQVDSIHLMGNAKISNEFLQRYLDIRNGSTFSRQKLTQVSKRMRELSYVEEEFPAKLVWLNSGSFLEMYLKQKKSSQVNVLIGFLPNTDALASKKLLVTGEANLNLKNALGAGETIGLNWQQLQVKSPRLNLLYQHPYLFGSPFGLDFSFDMFRKDSSFLNVNFQLGVEYKVDAFRTGKVFMQRFQTIVNGANTAYVLQQHRLPDEADVSTTNLGFDYEYINTNYRFNPTSGNELRITTTIGSKKIGRNTEIVELKDPSNPFLDFNSLYDSLKLKSYQFRIRGSAAKFFPIGQLNRATLKTAINFGYVQSANLFRNELFQIGGYKLLRGFDEESQYLSLFAVGTLEYRFLVGQNSYFYGFTDGGWGQNNSQNADVNYSYISSGLGLSFESKVGIFNLAWAVGKRSDLPFNLRQSKIHFGFLNYF
ncbi:MAG: POTRA domain-containing protein [Chitinophagaceae bacterium]